MHTHTRTHTIRSHRSGTPSPNVGRNLPAWGPRRRAVVVMAKVKVVVVVMLVIMVEVMLV